MIIVFDLDDTLYEELTFVYSGYKAVAKFLEPLLIVSAEQLFDELKKELSVQREGVFDRVLQKHGAYTKKKATQCLNVYRSHVPAIQLYPEAIKCLQKLKGNTLYLVTDGHTKVQKNKYKALGLDRWIKRPFFTYAHGRHRQKPSPYCFERICKIEKIEPSSVVYIGDNPRKDFVGIKPLGFRTVQVLTGPFADLLLDKKNEAEFKIKNLNELAGVLDEIDKNR